MPTSEVMGYVLTVLDFLGRGYFNLVMKSSLTI